MTPQTPHQRAELLLQEAEERLEKIKKLNLDKEEFEAQIHWLELRRFEIRSILMVAAEPDKEFQDAANERILRMEKDPWDAGLHGINHKKMKKPGT